jgi:hypothetical protein
VRVDESMGVVMMAPTPLLSPSSISRRPPASFLLCHNSRTHPVPGCFNAYIEDEDGAGESGLFVLPEW